MPRVDAQGNIIPGTGNIPSGGTRRTPTPEPQEGDLRQVILDDGRIATQEFFDGAWQTRTIDDPRDTTPTGGTGRTASQTALDLAQVQSLTDQTAIDREANRLRALEAENARRADLISQGTQLSQAGALLQQRAREMLADIVGDRPLRAISVLSGGVTRGREPADVLRERLGNVERATLPAFDATGSTAQLESGVQALQQFPTEIPQASGGFTGFAGGGSVDEGGISFGTTKRAVLLGEGGGRDGDEEVGIVDMARPEAGIEEVIPIVGGAQEGGSFSATARQSLADVFASLGLGPVRASTGTSGATQLRGQQGIGGIALSQRLGIEPQFIRTIGDPRVFQRDRQTGELRHITGDAFRSSGFNFGDVLEIGNPEFSGLSLGQPITEAVPIEGQSRRFPTITTPLSIDVGGDERLAIPAPRVLASAYRGFGEQVKNALAEAFALATGLGSTEAGRAEIERRIGFFTPSGTATRSRAALLG